MNLNELAKRISKLEGGKKNLSIAQIKEVIKCVGIALYECEDEELNEMVYKLHELGRRHFKRPRAKAKPRKRKRSK